jgi:hypothetical protein
VNKLLNPFPLAGRQQRSGSVHIDVSGRADEVAEPEAPALRRRGMGRSVNDRVDAGDRFAHPVAGRQVARDPLNPRVDARPAGENAHLMALLAQTRHDDPSEVSGPSGHEDSHLPLLFIACGCED